MKVWGRTVHHLSLYDLLKDDVSTFKSEEGLWTENLNLLSNFTSSTDDKWPAAGKLPLLSIHLHYLFWCTMLSPGAPVRYMASDVKNWMNGLYSGWLCVTWSEASFVQIGTREQYIVFNCLNTSLMPKLGTSLLVWVQDSGTVYQATLLKCHVT